MAQPGSKHSDTDPSRRKPVYGTQHAEFGGNKSTASPAGTGGLSAVTHPQASDRTSAVFGTRLPISIHQQLSAQANIQEALPSPADYREVTRTRRADPAMLRELSRHAQKAFGLSEADSGTLTVDRKFGTDPDTTESVEHNKGVGKSTWDLRIHRKEVSGPISGQIASISKESGNVTGLQSALVTEENAPEYEVLSELGSGSMGIIYRARQLSLNRELAIKTLQPTTTFDEHDQAMFVSEAVVTANLVHPNIVPIHDLGRTADGKLFYSMKQVTGTPWNEVIRDRSQEDNLDVFMKVCDAVAYAHSRGVVNRDLKPENVMVGNYGEVIVLDWGLAITTPRFEKRKSILLDFRGRAGTPVYMAPELAQEDVSLIGPHSDIYLLGAILFELIEGYQPHYLKEFWHLTEPQDQYNGVIWAVENNVIEENVGNSGELMRIARIAMSTPPEGRYGSVEALQEAIREYRITGRAEELMSSVDPAIVQDYTNYQSAVALYGEAIRKWPTNQRAIEGNRHARMAYAALAHQKGDIDLGLQILAGEPDGEFLPLKSKLKKTRLSRKIVRVTWGVTTVASFALMIVSVLLRFQAEGLRVEAVQQKEELEQKNGTIVAMDAEQKVLSAKEVKLKKKAEDAVALAKDAEKRKAEADTKLDEAKSDLALAGDKLKEANDLTVAAEKATNAANIATANAVKALQETEEARKLAQAKKDEAIVLKDEAIVLKDTSEFEGYRQRIDAFISLGEYDEAINVANEALSLKSTNLKILKKEGLIREKIESAKRGAGNVFIKVNHAATTASISADGRTVVMSSGAKEKMVTVLRTDSDHSDSVPTEIPIESKEKVQVAVSGDGRYFALTSRSVRQFWHIKAGDCEPMKVIGNTTRTGEISDIGWSFFSADSQRLYLVGSDSKMTIEIYSLEADEARLLLRQNYGDPKFKDDVITGACLVPDESALIFACSNSGGVRECRIRWNGEFPTLSRMEESPPREKTVDADFPQTNGIFVSPEGTKLALTFKDSGEVLILDRIALSEKPPYQLSFGVVESNAAGLKITCAFPVMGVQFSRGNQRIVTGHANKHAQFQVWDRQTSGYVASEEKGLYHHKPKGHEPASCLRGHSEAVLSSVFADGDADRMVSVSSDGSVRVWKLSGYESLVTSMKELEACFEDTTASLVPSAKFRGLGRDSRSVVASRWPERNEEKLRAIRDYGLGNYTMTAGPLPDEVKQPRQGQGIFSVRFSPDNTRLLLGADDLAAHVFNSETGQRVLTASMIDGRRDLFFDPEKNNFLEGHISEISAVSFLPPRGDLLLSSDYFGSISIWDAKLDENGIGYERSRLLSEYSFSEFAVSDDGSLILAAGAITSEPTGVLAEAKLTHMGLLWKTDEILESPVPKPFIKLTGAHKGFAITAVGISPSSKRVVTAGRRGEIVVWSAEDAQKMASVSESHGRDQVSGISFENENQLISVGYDGKVLRWTIEGETLSSVEIERKPKTAGQETETPEFIIRMRPSADRSRFATSEVSIARTENEKLVRLNILVWSVDGSSPVLVHTTRIPNDDLGKAFRHDVSWSSDGKEMLIVQEGVILVFDTANWSLKSRLTVDENLVRPVRGAFAPAAEGVDSRIATFDGRFTHLWNLTTKKHIAEFRSHASYNLTASFSSDQKLVATASETLRVFDADESSPRHGSTIFRLPTGTPHKEPLNDVAFSPVAGDTRLATIDQSGLLQIWNWQAEQQPPLSALYEPILSNHTLPEWMGDIQPGNTVQWYPDGKQLVVLQRGVASILQMQGEKLSQLKLPLPEGLQCQFNQLDISIKPERQLVTAGGVAWSEQDEQMQSFAAVWSLDGNGPKLVATIRNQHTANATARTGNKKFSPPTGITAIAFDTTADEIITGGSDSRLIRWSLDGLGTESVADLDFIDDLRRSGMTKPHSVALRAIDVAADGRIVTADEKGFYVLWPVQAQ